MIDLVNPYAWIMAVRRRLYGTGLLRSVKIGIPVISVGNLSSGGTGKTPFTKYLVRLLQARYGLRCAVVLRGYKRDSSGQVIVRDWDTVRANTRRSGDEAQIYARSLDATLVICDEDRVEGARMAREMGAEVVLLDDGFQHRRLKRDLDIVLVNALEGVPKIIPFGRGREGVGALRDADLVAITNYSDAAAPLKDVLRGATETEPLTVTTHIRSFRAIGTRQTVSMDHLRNTRALAVSGIGTPEGFERSLREAGIDFVSERFADHAEYDESTLDAVIAAATEHGCSAIVTTTKDEVKMIQQLTSAHRGIPIFIAEAALDLLGTELLLLQRLDSIFRRTTA